MGHKQQWLLKVSDNGGKLAVAVAVLWAGMGAEGISGQRRRRAGGREGKKRMDSGHPNGHYILPPFSYDAPSLFSLQRYANIMAGIDIRRPIGNWKGYWGL